MVKPSALCALLGLVGASFAATRLNAAVERRVRRTTFPRHELLRRDDTDPSLLYPAYNLSVPIDHFFNDSLYEPHVHGRFNLRYWFDAQFYKDGGPVIVLQSGETSGEDRLGFLQKGLLHQLAQHTHGIAVVLEHRYYGTSFPVPDLTTENMRFLTTDQALADEVFFAQNVKFHGLEHLDLTAPNTAYIGYGGSYAGAFNAFLRKLYPDVFWGTISSSGVTEAIWDYWAYFEPIRFYADKTCIEYTQKITHVVDNILISLKDPATTAELKRAWGLVNVTHDADFAQVLASGLDSWQGKNWDPALNDPTWDDWCNTIKNTSVVYCYTEGLKPTVEDLLKKGGYSSEVSSLTTPFLNWIGWLYENVVSNCTDPDQDNCWNSYNPDNYARDDITATWRSWPYQFCTQWGYLQTGSGVPANQLPLISRTNDLAFESLICKYAFNITTPANVDAINKYGGFGISYPRLAIVDGEWDPWRPATPHASPFNSTAKNRTSTVEEPFLLIEGAVHHWDENGLFPNETTASLPPKTITGVQGQEIKFVEHWMREWKREKAVKERQVKPFGPHSKQKPL
ncbi:putative serine protease K12H4.7 [Hyaloscypha bicolor E]|uniref:Putative serine protease K12H4.7 n=1 Tax=Hyaloscypha bicolor E TaxID=1095630 RepID=A0A2J6SW15_9HELO|nr:putative serine protease K12H4.7 [Hyaloscypha bicolor E]PMD54965.1 putative serine protease K12H4.7 [Hyaloscypha bicolor E]